jgi:hypothetical protein
VRVYTGRAYLSKLSRFAVNRWLAPALRKQTRLEGDRAEFFRSFTAKRLRENSASLYGTRINFQPLLDFF